jgi:hypothetical protein
VPPQGGRKHPHQEFLRSTRRTSSSAVVRSLVSTRSSPSAREERRRPGQISAKRDAESAEPLRGRPRISTSA